MTKKHYLVVVLLLFLTAVATFSITKADLVKAPEVAKDTELAKVMSFTVFGCSSCNVAKSELEKLEQEYPNLEFEHYSIVDDVDMANKYNVKEHPTVLFLNKEGQELSRVEKENTLEIYKTKVIDLQKGEEQPVEKQEQTTHIGSTLISLYLMKHSDGTYVEVPQFTENKTQVKYPKIAAVQRMISIQEELPESLHRTIPEGVSFQEITEVEGVTTVTLSPEFSRIENQKERIITEELLALTLFPFKGVEKVQIKSGDYSSPVMVKGSFEEKLSFESKYLFEHDGWTPTISVHQYNTNILHQEDMEHLPCFCGCGEAGHTSNFNCYFMFNKEGKRVLEKHAEYCQACLDITDIYKEMKEDGKNIKQIRNYIDEEFKNYKPTDTPKP